jgi:hypothetical protein
MFGFKKGKSDSLNIGLGVILDPNAMTLPSGFVDGSEAPVGAAIKEAAPITLVQKSKVGLMFVASLTF